MITLLHRAPRALTLGVGLTTTTLLLSPTSPFRPLLCDSPFTSTSNALPSPSSLFRTFQSESSATKPTTATTTASPSQAPLFRQVSSGSILGLASGIAVGMFSKTLTFLLGIGIAGVQYLESRGWHVVPTERIQGWVKGVNVRGLVRENVAFKICFGATFALAAFADF